MAKKDKGPKIVKTYVWEEKKDASGHHVDTNGNKIKKFKHKRGIVKAFFLTIITGGIYAITTTAKVTKELGKCRMGHGEKKPMSFIGVLFLTPLTLCILPIVWGSKVTKMFKEECEYRNIESPVKPWQYWVLGLLLVETVICPIIFCSKLLKASNLINKHHNTYGDVCAKTLENVQPEAIEAKPVKQIEAKPANEKASEPVEAVAAPAAVPVATESAEPKEEKPKKDIKAIFNNIFKKNEKPATQEAEVVEEVPEAPSLSAYSYDQLLNEREQLENSISLKKDEYNNKQKELLDFEIIDKKEYDKRIKSSEKEILEESKEAFDAFDKKVDKSLKTHVVAGNYEEAIKLCSFLEEKDDIKELKEKLTELTALLSSESM